MSIIGKTKKIAARLRGSTEWERFNKIYVNSIARSSWRSEVA